MDSTTLALKLIKAYETEHSRMRRAQAKKGKIVSNKEWIKSMEVLGLCSYLPSRNYKWSAMDFKYTRNYFYNSQHSSVISPFVSHGIKNAHIREHLLDIARMRGKWEEGDSRISDAEIRLKKIRQTPVAAALGKIWRELVDAESEKCKAIEARWQARCAINAVNKMDTGIQIKFGSCNRNGGSMSRIHHVVIDGERIPIKKFLENAEFETVILNS